MISKEEIEKEEVNKWLQSNEVPNFVKNYIEQLESKQQKITEELEKKIKTYKDLYISSSRDVKIHRHAQRILAEDILSILKGDITNDNKK